MTEETQDAPGQEPQQPHAAEEVVAQPAPKEEPAVNPQINPNVNVSKHVIEPLDPKKKEIQNPIHFMRVTNAEFEEAYKVYPKLDPESDRKIRDWLDTLRRARRHTVLNDTFAACFKRKDSLWEQYVDVAGNKLNLTRPLIGGAVSAGEKITGMKARLKMQKAISTGSPVHFPLWHSGIWLTLSTPSDGELLNMERAIANDKINLGRMTQGAVFAHTSVYMAEHIIRMVLEHIHDTNIKDFEPAQALELIRITDLTSMIHALACSVFPNGHYFQQPCVLHPDKCTYVAEDTVKFQNMFFYDTNAITIEQKRHMSNRNAKYTIDEIKSYQRKGCVSDGKTVTLQTTNEEIRLVLKVPNLKEYLETGMAWVQHIVDTVDKIISSDASITEKNEFIQKHSLISIFRQYGHWVEKIVFSDDSEISERDDIESALTDLSGDTTLYQKFFEAIQQYIEEVTVTVIGIPSYRCPSCGTPMTSEESKHPHIIPVEVMQTFFTLSHRRLDRIRLLANQ